ncbi:hypothetical protein [Ornithinimicrobium kibberense]|uniref:hypothetical protein n=1 Tax=Ornithinimicrobium kibberense TaxID=282060 RepID=UPI003614F5B6
MDAQGGQLTVGDVLVHHHHRVAGEGDRGLDPRHPGRRPGEAAVRRREATLRRVADQLPQVDPRDLQGGTGGRRLGGLVGSGHEGPVYPGRVHR